MNTRRIAWFGIGVVIMALVVIGVVTVTKTTQAADNTNEVVKLIREDQQIGQKRSQETKDNTETIKRLAEAIESCTTPDGECAQRNQRRTGDAIGSITDFNIYLAVCEKRPDVFSVDQFKTCVQELLVMQARRGGRS